MKKRKEKKRIMIILSIAAPYRKYGQAPVLVPFITRNKTEMWTGDIRIDCPSALELPADMWNWSWLNRVKLYDLSSLSGLIRTHPIRPGIFFSFFLLFCLPCTTWTSSSRPSVSCHIGPSSLR